jgi:hypothetical protein
MTNLPEIDDHTKIEIEAAAFRKMIEHFQKYPEVQNIDLMNLGYFCRNCFSNWYMGAASDQGIELDTDQAREIIYGMPFTEYKAKYQEKASDEQLNQFKTSKTKATE